MWRMGLNIISNIPLLVWLPQSLAWFWIPMLGFYDFFCHSFWTEQGYHYLLHLSRFSSTRVYWNHEYSMSQNFWKNTIFLTNKWFLNREPIWLFVGISPSTVIGKDSTKKAEKSTIVQSVVILSLKVAIGQTGSRILTFQRLLNMEESFLNSFGCRLHTL